MTQAFGPFQVVEDEEEADIVLMSVFPHAQARYPDKTIVIIGENVRPRYDFYRFSLSCDFDTYGGRNFRLPEWYGELQWTGDLAPRIPCGSHGHEERVEIDSLLAPREHIELRPKFCCLVSSYREAHRALALEALSQVGEVDVFGGMSGEPVLRSKYDFLREYRFNLCFENSIFPGYYTEKAFQAWAAGCIPLYFSDPYFTVDFNPRAIINRISFPTLAAFVEEVRRVNQSAELMTQYLREPLLLERPSLEPAVAFLRRAAREIMGLSA